MTTFEKFIHDWRQQNMNVTARPENDFVQNCRDCDGTGRAGDVRKPCLYCKGTGTEPKQPDSEPLLDAIAYLRKEQHTETEDNRLLILGDAILILCDVVNYGGRYFNVRFEGVKRP